MTNIEKFNYGKNLYNSFKKYRDKVLGIGSGNIDKHGLYFRFENRNAGNAGDEIHIFSEAYYGFYGSSSVYSVFNDEHYKYIVKSLNLLTKEILQKASELIERDLKRAANNARNEASEVLKLTDENNNKGDL